MILPLNLEKNNRLWVQVQQLVIFIERIINSDNIEQRRR